MRNIDRESITKNSKAVTGIAQMLDPTNFVFSVVDKSLIKPGHKAGSFHHHIRLLLVAFEARNKLELLCHFFIPESVEIVLVSE